MTGADLRRLVGAMTPGPYRQGNFERFNVFVPFEGMSTERVLLRMNQHFPCDSDAKAIAALANHADVLVALVEACERRWSALCNCRASVGHSSDCELELAKLCQDAVLARVEAQR